MKYIAMLKDSFLEALDCKSLYVMFVISLLFIILLASMSYTQQDAAGTIRDMTDTFNVVHGGRDVGSFWIRSYAVRYNVDGVRDLGPEAKTFAGGWEFTVSLLTSDDPERRKTDLSDFYRLVRHWDGTERGMVKKQTDTIPDADKAPPPELSARFLRSMFLLRQVPKVTVEPVATDPDGATFTVKIKPWSRQTFAGAYKCHFLFGLVSFPLTGMSVAMWVFGIEVLLSQYLAGIFGVMIGIVFTADFVPNMLQKGRIDLLLARPINRSTILLYKYLGGILYAAITGAVFIGGSFLVLSFRSGVWNWGFLASLGTLVFFFAVLSSIGTLVGVMTRNTILSIVAPLGMWALGFGVTWTKNQAKDLISLFRVPDWLDRTLEIFSYFLPRASDFNVANQYFMRRYAVGDEVLELMRQQERLPQVPWVTTLVSSALFILVMLSAACWIFSRRDH